MATYHEYFEIKEQFNEKMVELIDHIACKLELSVILLPMHSFFYGFDDRDYYRDLKRKLSCSKNVSVIDETINTSRVIQYYKKAEMAICMRYHSVVFAILMGVPTIAIDYNIYGKKGKATGFLEMVNKDLPCFNIKEIIKTDIIREFDEIYNNKDKSLPSVASFIEDIPAKKEFIKRLI